MAGWNDTDFCASDTIFEISGNRLRQIYIDEPEPPIENNESLETIDGIPVRTLFVSRIPAEAKWADVFKAFAMFGEIKKLFLKNGTFKPFAFVTYTSPKSAVRALCHSSVYVLHKKVYVSKGDSWHQPVERSDGTVDWSKQLRRSSDFEEVDEEEEDESIEEDKIENVQDSEGFQNSINVLNDDCLRHIFSYLNYKERLGIEKVCKRWQAINLNMWLRVHSLDFTDASTFCIPVLNLDSLECLLKRCNSNLKFLNLSRKTHKLNSRALFIIAKYCKDIEELHISHVQINNRSLPHLAKYCTKLKKIVFHGCKQYSDKDLLKWFSMSTELTSVTLSNARGIIGNCLHCLKGPLEYLNLNDCVNLVPSILLDSLSHNSSTLKQLSLNGCICLRNNDIARIVKAVPNLTSFSLAQSFPLFNKASLLPLGYLDHLEELNLSQNGSITDQVLAAIVNGCTELRCLNLSGCRDDEGSPFTPEGLAKLGKLRNLVSLNISYLMQTTDSCLIDLITKSSRLKVIKCMGCPELTDEGCTQVVSLCNELEQFDLSGNTQISCETVKTALDSVKLCTNRKPLELIVGGTSVRKSTDSDDSRLIINRSDFSEFHLRPDFVDNLFFPPEDHSEDDDLCNEIELPQVLYKVMHFPSCSISMEEVMADFDTEYYSDSDSDDSDFNTDDSDFDLESEIIFKCF